MELHRDWHGYPLHDHVHAVLVPLLVPAGVQGLPFRLVLQLHGVFLRFLLSIRDYHYSDDRNTWVRHNVSI